MKSILVAGLMFCLAIPAFHATGQERAREDKSAPQSPDNSKAGSTDNPIEVKTDRFSNVITVILKPQVIFEKPDHFITVEIKTKLGEKKSSDFEKEIVQAYVTFESQSKGLVDFGDEELIFLINGQALNLGKSEFTTIPNASRLGKLKPDFRLLKFSVKILDRPNLDRFSKANRIEMRLGSIETTLSNQLVATLREYATQVLAQHRIATEKQ
jgi:hypothetical protein